MEFTVAFLGKKASPVSEIPRVPLQQRLEAGRDGAFVNQKQTFQPTVSKFITDTGFCFRPVWWGLTKGERKSEKKNPKKNPPKKQNKSKSCHYLENRMKIPAVSLELDVSITFQTHQESLEGWNEKGLPKIRREDKATHKQINDPSPKTPNPKQKPQKKSRVSFQPAVWSCSASQSPSTSAKGLTTSVQHRNLFIVVGGRNLSALGMRQSQRQAPAAAYIPNIKDTIYI